MGVSIPLNIPGLISGLEASRHGLFHIMLDCSVSLQNRVLGCELNLESGIGPVMTLELSPHVDCDLATCEGPKLS